MSKFLSSLGISHNVLNAKNHEKEAEIISKAGKKGAVTIATNMAGRGTDIKLGGLESTDNERNEILNIEGLVVLGSERHESRRIDNQLRGRSGRQGDPGLNTIFCFNGRRVNETFWIRKNIEYDVKTWMERR